MRVPNKYASYTAKKKKKKQSYIMSSTSLLLLLVVILTSKSTMMLNAIQGPQLQTLHRLTLTRMGVFTRPNEPHQKPNRELFPNPNKADINTT